MENKKNTVNREYIIGILEKSEIRIETAFNKCTIVAVKLPNNFVIVESSACVDEANYDEEMGFNLCMKKIEDKIWELEGYVLQNSQVFANKILN